MARQKLPLGADLSLDPSCVTHYCISVCEARVLDPLLSLSAVPHRRDRGFVSWPPGPSLPALTRRK